MNTFNAALDAEYAGKDAAGTIATFDPVKMILVGLCFPTRKGRKACVNATRLK